MLLLVGCASSASAEETAIQTTTASLAATSAPSTAEETVLAAPVPTVTTELDSTTSTTGPKTTTVAPTTTTVLTTTTMRPVEPLPSATLPPSISGTSFSATIEVIDDVIEARLVHSWRTGCPVPLADLRLITLTHWDFDGQTTRGELVVDVDHAQGIVDVFSTLYDARFPIERMELVDSYGGDDDRSMAANNTSAFNCREVAWKPGVWSNHAFGTAIDINPLVNPYVSKRTVLPPEGSAFADRSVEARGGIYPGDVVTEAFARIGWTWGGTWSSAKDWQHFSASGG